MVNRGTRSERWFSAVYFRDLLTAVEAMERDDRLMFTDWRGDPDERLAGPGTEVGTVFAAAASRGVDIRGLVWRSHWDRFQFSANENRHLGEEIEAAGGQCLLDMRVRPMGRTTRSSSCFAIRGAPNEMLRTSVASTCATAAVTTTGTGRPAAADDGNGLWGAAALARHPARRTRTSGRRRRDRLPRGVGGPHPPEPQPRTSSRGAAAP
jgi:hypothetical protein